MENPFEILENKLSELKELICQIKDPQTEHIPGVDLDAYISLQKVAELYSISPKTLVVHKNEIQHVKRFGQIFFLKKSLSDYMEGGRPVIEMKKVMRTKRGRAATV
ncbi:hypothetical protein DSL64_03330 [Dyadobacter luteus]|uniref:Uncharacterized protein n=1 Tax=Dyadobacter luteus TaxID=2259619 RepID=A0A3D8YFS2_9BACT|nr:helix-turn-helix domain-containing protein [Dyadobacter luteus]REA63493.1 hypothetical protein DSL64_03330 [Dyadobacter luteus]